MTSNTLPIANEEMANAARHLERERPGYGLDFFDACDRAVDDMAQTPRQYPHAEDAPPGREVRYVYLSRYHYRVLYLVLPNELVIVAFAHTSREPGYWHDRLP